MHWHIAPIPSPAFANCMCLPNFCLLYCTISFAFVDLQEYLGLAAGDSTIPASNVLRSLFWVRDDIGKYDSDMAGEKLIPVPPPSPGPFNDSAADRYADWKSLMKLACTAFSVQRPRNWLFLQSGDGTTRLSNLPFSCDASVHWQCLLSESYRPRPACSRSYHGNASASKRRSLGINHQSDNDCMCVYNS